MLVFNSLKFLGGQHHPAVCLVILGRDAVTHDVNDLTFSWPSCCVHLRQWANIFSNYLQRKISKLWCHSENVTSWFAFPTTEGKIKSLLEELSVGASPGATLQMSSLWAGIFWWVPQTRSRQRARSYNTWSESEENIIRLIHDRDSWWCQTQTWPKH